MKITWLGQAGLYIEACGKKIIVDPYLSDCVVKVNPKNYRRQPIDTSFLQIKPDIIVCTHDHLDHFDMETLPHYLDNREGVLVLCPTSCFEKLGKYRSMHNCVEFDRHCEWTEGTLSFKAVRADHSDPFAIGVIISDGKQTCYITGDTLYNSEIFEDIRQPIDVLFLPINGVGNNMNRTDAARFAAKIGAKKTVPLHWGLFDELSPADFDCAGKVVPEIYKEIPLTD